jgi:hypothetical protein
MKGFKFTFPPFMMNLLVFMVQSFQPHLSNPRALKTGFINTARSNSGIPLSATIYSWDDKNDEKSSNCYRFDEGASIESILSHTHVTELLLQGQEKIATLARLAATHCQDSSLILENIQDVHVISVDNEHIEISAIMCNDDSCVSVLVPVQFLNPCNVEDDSNLTECILENILDLDELALKVIQQKDLWNNIDLDGLLMEEYLSQPENSYPIWWISAEESINTRSTHSHDMDENCSLNDFQDMKRFLNNDNFEKEITSFARQLIASNEKKGYQVFRARVTEVGPLGICLRAMVLDRTSSPEQGLVIDIYHQFDEYVSDNNSLRRSVLAALK